MSGCCFQLIDAGILLLFFIYFYSLFLFSISILYFYSLFLFSISILYFYSLFLFLIYPILMNCNVVRWLVKNGDQEPQKLQKHTYKLYVYVFNILHHNHANSTIYYLFLTACAASSFRHAKGNG